MKLEPIILDAGKIFLANQFPNLEKINAIKLESVENPFGLFPKNTKSTFKLSGFFLDNCQEQISFSFFVKVAQKNEIMANKLVSLRADSVIPEIYAYYPLDNSENLFLVFAKYVENSKSLWYLINSLKVRSGSLKEHHHYAGEILKIIASKLGSLHYLLSVDWLKQNNQYSFFKVLHLEDIAETITRGIDFLKTNSSRYNFTIPDNYIIDGLEKYKDLISHAIVEYPFKGLVHGDMQISNIIWQPENESSFYFVDWNNTFIGPQILDLYSFVVDNTENTFIEAYLNVSSELYQIDISIKEMDYYLVNAIIYQSLRLVSHSADLLDAYKSSNGELAAGIVETLLKRISIYLQKLEEI